MTDNSNLNVIPNDNDFLENDINNRLRTSGILNRTDEYQFFETHIDPRNGEEVITLTETGLLNYFENRKEETDLLNNTELILDMDRGAGPDFSPEIGETIKKEITKNSRHERRHNYIIHRDGHTVALMQEGDTFLLLDSYNAHGTPDMDHIPLLQIIRDTLPEAKIYTLHDRIQSDYNNCRVFATEGTIECERFMRKRGMRLNDLIALSFTENIFDNKNRYESDREYNLKDCFYNEIGVEQISTPIPLVPFIQSYTSINTATPGDNISIINFTEREDGQTYADFLYKNTENNKNRTIQNIANRHNLILYNSLIKTINSFDTVIQERTDLTGVGPA